MQHSEQLNAALKPGSNKKSSHSYDYSSYFKNISSQINSSDLTIANMETCFAPPPYTGYPSFSSPASLAAESRNSGIDVLLAANNHTCDKGSRGISGSISTFRSLGIPYTGIYSDSLDEKRSSPLIINKKGFRIAILNYTYGTNGIKVPFPFVVKMIDSAVILRDIQKARAANPHFIIACLHWGVEYNRVSGSYQKRWESFFNRHGIDIIIGSHPHVPQNYVVKRDISGTIRGITVYSLGNAISNMSAPFTRIGMLCKVNLVKNFHGKTSIAEPQFSYIWTSRPGEVEKNFSILPIEEFKNRRDAFKVKQAYDKMMYYYSLTIK